MNRKIVSDSSSNLHSLSDIPFQSVPLKVIFGDNEYVDTKDTDLLAMTEALKKHKGTSGTSCPNVQDWEEAFSDAEEIFAVTISGTISGSYSSAQNAAQSLLETHPDKKIHVINTLSAGAEMELVIEKLQELILAEHSFEEIQEKITEYLKHTHLLFCLQSLLNFARNGRVNPAAATIAGLLSIRIVGQASDTGELQLLHKCRGEKKSLDTLLEEMKANGYCGGKVRMCHCLNEEAAIKFRDMVLSEFPNSDVTYRSCGALCGYYAEQGGLLVGYEDLPPVQA